MTNAVGGPATVAQRPRTNRLAVASLVVSCAGLLWGIVLAIAPIVGVVLGLVARSQIKRDPMSSGGGIALAGVIVGVIGSAWWLWFWTISVLTNFEGH